jgi:chromosome segregation ATPase
MARSSYEIEQDIVSIEDNLGSLKYDIQGLEEDIEDLENQLDRKYNIRNEFEEELYNLQHELQDALEEEDATN